MNRRVKELVAMSKALDNLLNIVKTLTPNEDTPFTSYVFNVQTQGENLRYYMQEEIKKELLNN